ncbi:MAG: ParB/RepB/Spo0J family partition protein [Rhodospirillaceae bacterium]|nr:ParB/RepB/Spo0J family partition protein [Rhodospirillaceae bacterium]MBT5944060.1 ParB/RepB/Spo0J family partition protein [Rhodospirillaceae bacterium]MBT6402995.1 ParB/RepB/Spo0J family partition protein [Rhodospirillaceae bacterium]MBT6537658.1 ParB/RepB/Spo0J family partition protein [Rhodospirillaceae bacterium]
MSEPTSRPRLGRGLSALLGDDGEDYQELDKAKPARELPIEQLHPGRFQPRTNFDEDELASLVESIREKGILQPILVRRDPVQADLYEIIAGERRWRAAQRAKLHEVPVIIRELDDRAALEIALIENIQRADLSPIEEAEGYQRLMDHFSHTQDALAKAMGKSRSHIANQLRLLTLPDEVRQMIDRGELTAGHARALVGREDAVELARQITRDGMTVRDIEGRVSKAAGRKKPRKAKTPKSTDTLALERDLSDVLGLKVSINPRGDESSGKGVLEIEFSTFDQLDDVLQRLNRNGRPAAGDSSESRGVGIPEKPNN